MAAVEANLDLDWRDPTNPLISDLPWPLDNSPLGKDGPMVKCYRNVVFIWLFHTQVLLNYIDDNHGLVPRCKGCLLCDLRLLADRFWDAERELDTSFERAVDRFWHNTKPGLIIDLHEQNDAEEYLKGLLDVLYKNCDDKRWACFFSVQKHTTRVCMGCKTLTPSTEIDWILQGEFSEDDLEYMPLCKILRFKKREEFGCGKCSKATEHEFSSRLLNAPPILVIHCKPLTYGELLSDGTYQTWVDGKVKRLEHSMALSTYSDTSLDRKSVSWAFYHLYGVVLRRGDGGTDGHYVCAFEQRQTGRWLFFDDEGRPVTRQLSRSQLDHRVETMIHDKRRSWSIFMLMYRKLFEVPVRLLARITSSSRAIALQNQQFQKESGQSKTEVAGQPETEEDGELEIQKSGEAGTGDAQEEYFTPEDCVGDEDLLAESESGQTRGETQGPAGDERLLEDSSDSKIRHVQAEQSMPTEQPAVEADPESSTSKSNETQGAADDKLQSNPSDSKTPLGQAEQSMPIEQPAEQNVEVEADPELSIPKPATEQTTGETQGAADNVSQRDASDSEIQNGQAEQPLPADPPTEQGVEVEADPESSTAKPDTTKSGSRAQAENENEQMTSSQPKSETVGTEIEPSAQPKKKQAKGKSAKRPRDKALDEDEETSTSVSASKKPKAGAKSSTQPKKKETQPDATTGNEDEKAEKSAPRIKKAKTVVEPSASYGGRETRARAAAKRKNDQIPDVDKNQDEQAATAQPASKKARTTKASEQTVKAQPKSKAGRKK